jgi:Protein of unknown function (DUF1493)
VTSELPDRVLALVSWATGVGLEKLQPATTLSGDLGMEGDDAVEFFKKFGTKFAVDLSDLHRDWKFYFSPEGVPLVTGLLVTIPVVVVAILLERVLPRLRGMIALGIAALLWLAVLVRWSTWRYKNRTAQVAIEDLIRSASSGKWTKSVPEELVRRMNKSKFYDRFVAR